MKAPMKGHKEICSRLGFDGYRYSGFWGGYYRFCKEVRDADGMPRYLLMKCLLEDLTEPNMRLMCKDQITRI